VLIGDAAGHNDPSAGCGLSIAMRDARTARDLILDGARTADAFASYGAERFKRMETLRLIADIVSVTHAEDADNRQARREYVAGRMANNDPAIMGILIGAFVGPETIPDELLDPGILDQIRAA
jgi:2-polyprenyl-6-methoxyphenol hydroxylase-like FAD-dependent oxidoreductase